MAAIETDTPEIYVEISDAGPEISVELRDESPEINVTVEGAGPAGPGVPSGGSAGQVLKKASGADYDTEWEDSVIERGTGEYSAIFDFPDKPASATEKHAVAVGPSTVASGQNAFAAGYQSIASGHSAVAMGAKMPNEDPNTASGQGAVAIGGSNLASGNEAVALGAANESSGNYSFTAGVYNEASGQSSVAMGRSLIATGRASAVFGQANEEDESPVDDLHGVGSRELLMIVGNGVSPEARSNAMTMDWDGNMKLAGSLTLGAGTADETEITASELADLLDGGGGGSGPSPYASNPAPLGTASPGSSADYARGDHVHPKPTAADVGAIAAPASPATGAFLVWNGSAWTAQTLSTWQGGSY